MGRHHPATRLAAVALIAAMALGSIFLWLGIPFLWIWGASQLVESSQPSMGAYVVVLVGIPASMFVVGRGLARLNHVYGRLTGTTPTVRVRTPWLRSLRGERTPSHPRTVLDVVMVVSVAVALLLFGLWFLFLAEGGGLPG